MTCDQVKVLVTSLKRKRWNELSAIITNSMKLLTQSPASLVQNEEPYKTETIETDEITDKMGKSKQVHADKSKKACETSLMSLLRLRF